MKFFSLLACVLAPVAALMTLPLATRVAAQTATPEPQTQATSAPVEKLAHTQRVVRRIRIEDANARIDEVRVGSETQSISVQPKAGNNTLAYEIKVPDSARGSAPSPLQSDTNGARVWNVLNF